MRIARWTADGVISEGIVVGDRLVRFSGTLGVTAVLAGGLDAAIELGERLSAAVPDDAPALSSVELLAPVQPPSVRDFVAFEEHIDGIVRSMDNAVGVPPQWYEFPTFYFTNPHSLIGTGAVVIPPAASARMDFELEVGAVIGGVPGSDGASLTPQEAGRHIFGYTVFNDWSARDVQAREMAVRLGPCKGKDFATTLGPWITTADEVADRLDSDGFLDLRMSVSVNGTPIGEDTLADLGWPFAEMIAYASRDTRVVPGDVLGSGTAGSGCLAELWGRAGRMDPPPLQAGDEVTMTVERLGTVTNVLGLPRPTPPIPPARPRPGSPAARRRSEGVA
jgi:2-keto-4-pentenoate hydratase/2-oxohepta-3-ene-1,7-dioic acid hydratase in catechol pathway